MIRHLETEGDIMKAWKPFSSSCCSADSATSPSGRTDPIPRPMSHLDLRAANSPARRWCRGGKETP